MRPRLDMIQLHALHPQAAKVPFSSQISSRAMCAILHTSESKASAALALFRLPHRRHLNTTQRGCGGPGGSEIRERQAALSALSGIACNGEIRENWSILNIPLTWVLDIIPFAHEENHQTKTDTSGPLSELRCSTGREMRTQYRSAPHGAASRPPITSKRLRPTKALNNSRCERSWAVCIPLRAALSK